ncbi:MAG: aromatic acid exporter family protein [Peptoniphilus harei]|nr:aromatic acid exporter family protein [Peptoniphilus harei]
MITILDIFETRKDTVKGGVKRTLSAIIALVLGILVFEIFAYRTWALHILTLVCAYFFFIKN